MIPSLTYQNLSKHIDGVLYGGVTIQSGKTVVHWAKSFLQVNSELGEYVHRIICLQAAQFDSRM